MTRLRPRPRFAAAALFALATPLFAQTPPPQTPQPAAPKAPGPPIPSREALAEGKILLAKVVEFLGGPQKIASIRDVSTRGRLTAKTPEGDATMEVQSAMVFPSELVQEVDSPFGRVVMVVTPESAFLAGPQGAQDLPPAAANELRKQLQRIPLNLTRHAGDPKLVAAAAGPASVGEVATTMLDVSMSGTAVRWFVDPKTGRILRTSHTGASPDGQPVRMISDYHDYKTVDGVPVAHRLEITSNGERDQTLVIDEYKFNAGIDRKLFEKPPPKPAGEGPRHPLHSAPVEPTPNP